MYSKRNPYPKVIALLRWQLEYLECTRTSYSSTAAEPPSKIGNKTKAKRSIAHDLHFQDLYKNLWGHFDQLSFRRFGERVAARLRVLTAGGGLKGMRGLDVGCGSGAYTFGAAALGAHCIGIDPGVGNISFARKIAKRTGDKGVVFRKGSAYKLEFAAGIFDFVICQGVLHHLENPEQVDGRLLSTPVHRIMNADFIAVGLQETDKAKDLLTAGHIFVIPVIDSDGKIIGVKTTT